MLGSEKMKGFRDNLKNRLSGDQGYRIMYFLSRNPIASRLVGMGFGDKLNHLAIINNTDKYRVGGAGYMNNYAFHFKRLRRSKVHLLEIGVGGYKRPERGGASLRMWKRYFYKGQIVGIDLYDKSPQNENRIKTYKGSQVDTEFLQSVLTDVKKKFDIIIDDGSHVNEHVINTFQFLFPRLKSNGIYVVEDTLTSYRNDYGGDAGSLEAPHTMMNYFKSIPDMINFDEHKIATDQMHLKDMISSIHFYKNQIFIYKK